MDDVDKESNVMNITIGPERLSITVVRKTEGDLLVSQHSSERWFKNEADATEALRQVMEAFVEEVPATPHERDTDVRDS